MAWLVWSSISLGVVTGVGEGRGGDCDEQDIVATRKIINTDTNKNKFAVKTDINRLWIRTVSSVSTYFATQLTM